MPDLVRDRDATSVILRQNCGTSAQLRDTIPFCYHSSHTSSSLPLLTTVSPLPPPFISTGSGKKIAYLHRPGMQTSQKFLCYRHNYSPRFIGKEEAEMSSVTCPKSHSNQRCGQTDPGPPESRAQGLPRWLSEDPLKKKSPFAEM